MDKWLGVLESDHRSAPEQWGLDGGEDDCVLPAGLLLPRFDGQKLVALHGVAIAGAGRAGAVKTAPGGIAEGLFYPAASLLEVPGMPARGKTAPALWSRTRFRLFWPGKSAIFVRSFLWKTPANRWTTPGTPWPRPPPFIFCEGGPPRETRSLAKRLSRDRDLVFRARGNDLRRPSRGRKPPRPDVEGPAVECFPKHALDPFAGPGEPPDETFMQGFRPPDIKTINDKLREDLLNHLIAETEALLNGHPQFREAIGRAGGVDLRAMLAEQKISTPTGMAMVVSLAQKVAMLDGAKPGNSETLKPMMEENIAGFSRPRKPLSKPLTEIFLQT